MTKNEVIVLIHREGKIREVCINVGKYIGEDLYSELLVILLNYPNLVQLYESSGNQFNFFVIRIITLMFHSPRHPFYKMYRQRLPTPPPLVPSDVIEKIQFEIDLHKTNKAIDKIKKRMQKLNKFPFEAILFELYLTSGSYRNVSKKTRIPLPTIHRAINNLKKEILSEL